MPIMMGVCGPGECHDVTFIGGWCQFDCGNCWAILLSNIDRSCSYIINTWKKKMFVFCRRHKRNRKANLEEAARHGCNPLFDKFGAGTKSTSAQSRPCQNVGEDESGREARNHTSGRDPNRRTGSRTRLAPHHRNPINGEYLLTMHETTIGL